MPRGGRREGAGRPRGSTAPRRPKAAEPGSVMYVRFPKDTAEELRARAAERRITAAALLREIAAKWLGE